MNDAPPFEGRGTQRSRAAGPLLRDAPRILRPPHLLCEPLIRRLVGPAQFERYVVPHIADMHEEYFACLLHRDQHGARWVVVRATLYVIHALLIVSASWIWSRLWGSLRG